tara:strand:+ start:183 stop:539 length:357 start_codon:yes stop_codon:yes gene_type:complete
MAHFAKIGVGNIVEKVLVVHNDELLVDGVENEQKGISFLQNLFKSRDNYIQTSYNGNFRKNYAGIGFSYNSELNAFIEPQPFNSWKLNKDTCKWEPPTPKPLGAHDWNESTRTWDAAA